MKKTYTVLIIVASVLLCLLCGYGIARLIMKPKQDEYITVDE